MAEINLFEQYPELAGKVILNVDDNEMNQMLMAKIMDNVGIKTILASNGAEAIKLLHEGLKPDLILLDLEMPVMGGLQTAEFIKNKIDSDVPIIINSGYVSVNDKWKLKRLKIIEFLEKPYSMKDILSKISKNLQSINVL